jgi:zinc transport system ATP-binding protein
MNTIVQIKELSVFYEDTCALENINLNINEGDFLGIIGPNGGGKTTLLKAILGFIAPSEGSISIQGNSNFHSKIKIGYVPQHTVFDRNFPINVLDVILMGLLNNKNLFLRRFSIKEKETALCVMKQVGISELKNRQIGQLSGGQMQKVLLSRTLLQKPDLILLDEPTASMDTASRTRIYEIIKALNKEMTIVAVTHDTSFISSHVKTIACLNKKLFYHGEPALDESVVEQVYGCPVELLAHGIPHRVLKEHGDEQNV